MIGGVLGFIGRHWKGILIWTIVALGFWWAVQTFGAGNVFQVLFIIAATLFQLAFAILFVINKVWGLRVKPEEEQVGLDIAVHGEEGYT